MCIRDRRDVREQLDAVSPGLGNPVMPVSVSVDEPETVDERQDDPDDLMPTLRRIEERLEELRRRLPAQQG